MTLIWKRSAMALMILFSGFLWSGSSWAVTTIEFGPQETEIKASIKYTVIGQYVAGFDKFKGVISFNPQTGEILSVDLQIESGSIHSNCKTCDNIVRSPQLLDTARFETITFNSSSIITDESGYRVVGTLDMHGQKREMSFPFEAVMVEGPGVEQNILDIKGKWIINRKEFDIVWNRLLDKGGVLVGNHITVKWGIKTVI